MASHVRALAEPNFQEWDAAEAKFEREREKRLRAEAEERKRAEAEARRIAAEKAAQEAAATPLPFGTQEEKPTATIDQAFESPDEGGRQKRRRSTVDYVALNKKLEEEAKNKTTPTPQ